MKTTRIVLELDLAYPEDTSQETALAAVAEYLAIRNDVLPLPIGHLPGARTIDLIRLQIRFTDREQRLSDALQQLVTAVHVAKTILQEDED